MKSPFPQEKKTRQLSNWKSTGPILDGLFLNHYPLVWGNSNRLSRSLDLHWEWPVRLDDSLHECLTRLSTEFSPSLFLSLHLSLFSLLSFRSLVLKPIQPLFMFMLWLRYCFLFFTNIRPVPFAFLMKHVFSWPCQPRGLTQACIHTGHMMVTLDYVVNTLRQKTKQNVICKRKTREQTSGTHNFGLMRYVLSLNRDHLAKHFRTEQKAVWWE